MDVVADNTMVMEMTAIVLSSYCFCYADAVEIISADSYFSFYYFKKPCERRGTDGNRQAKSNRASLCLTCRDYATCLGMLQEQGRFFSLFFSF